MSVFKLQKKGVAAINVLPTGPFHLGKDLQTYFEHLRSFQFDVAYIAYYAYGWAQTTGEFRQKYIEFANEAHRRGYKACVQIQTVLACEEDIPISEAQCFSNGEPVTLGRGIFMASYASQIWRDYLKKLGRLFVKEYGYDWIVHEEPCWPVDIPGKPDRIYQKFMEAYPDAEYPLNPEGTSLNAEQFRNNFRMLDRKLMRSYREHHRRLMDKKEYETVQRFKMDVLVDYFEELAQDAKAGGAEKFGLMPWIFTPTTENTPAVTMNSCNHLGRLGLIDKLDLLVVRMQPDNIFYHDDPFNGLIDEQGEAEPRLYYLETMAHQLNKQVITVNNPINERNFIVSRTGEHSGPLPKDFYRRCTLAVMAASPNGMTRHWYDKSQFEYDREAAEESTFAHNVFQAELIPWLTRLGSPVARLGFVFSFEASCRANPPGRQNTWRSYYRFMKEMMYVQHTPVKTLYTGILKKNLSLHPEIDIAVLCEQHKLEREDKAALNDWLEEKGGRFIVGFGSIDYWKYWLEEAGKARIEIRNGLVTAILKKRNGNEVRLYDLDLREAAPGQIAIPVSLALQEIKAEPWVRSDSEQVLWSPNRWGYISVSNTAPSPAVISIHPPSEWRLYNVKNRCWEERDADSILLQPYEHQLWRGVHRFVPWLDVQGQISIRNITQQENERKASFALETGPNPIRLDMLEPPSTVYVNGKSTPAGIGDNGAGHYSISIPVDPGSNVQIDVEWSNSK